MLGRTNSPLQSPHYNPQTCKYVTSSGRMDFTDVIKFRIKPWREAPGSSRWTQYNPNSPYNTHPKASESDKEMVKETPDTRHQTDATRMQVASQSWKRQGNSPTKDSSFKDFAPLRPIFELQPLNCNTSVSFQDMLAIRYSSYEKLVYPDSGRNTHPPVSRVEKYQLLCLRTCGRSGSEAHTCNSSIWEAGAGRRLK